MARLADRITVNPKQCCVRGIRIRVSDVLELLAAGMTWRRIVAEHPDLELGDIRACLQFASRQLDHPMSGGGERSASVEDSAAWERPRWT
jgi:uncharacterized protein (DUF433 family)